MIRLNNRIFWLIAALVMIIAAILFIRPVHQAFGAVLWDPTSVPLYTRLLADKRIALTALVIVTLLVLPLFLAPLWDLVGLLDNAAMTLARAYYNSGLVSYPVGHTWGDVDAYLAVRRFVQYAGVPFRFMKKIPILDDVYALFFDDAPSSRVALLLINRIHEANYGLAHTRKQVPQYWKFIANAEQALIAHTLVGTGLSTNSQMIGALLLDDLHSQNYVLAARYGIDLSPRLPIWRKRATALYRQLASELDEHNLWSAWIPLRVLWLDLFVDNTINWFDLPIVEEQFWRLTELAEDERGIGIAIAAAHRLANDLGALRILGQATDAPELLRFGTDLGYWLDTTADKLQATVWHTTPSSRASELPPGTFLAAQLIPGIGPKWQPPELSPSDAIRGQMIAARAAIYDLIKYGWQGIVSDEELEQAQNLTERAVDEITVRDEFGGRA